MGAIDDLRASINNYRNMIATNNRKIERLNVTKTELANAKDTIKTYKSNWENNVAASMSADMTWYGTNKDLETDCAVNEITANYDTYINNIDYALDAVCDKITALQNEIYEWHGAIGWLEARINDLINEARKALN